MQIQSEEKKKVVVNPVVLVLIAGIILGGYGFWNVYWGYESKSWPTTQGVIIDSRIAGSTRIIGRKAFIKYEYFLDGECYVSPLVSYTWKCVDYQGSIDILREYPKDTLVTVYYNPANHDNAVLKTEISGRISWLFAFSFLTILIGLRGIQWQRKKRNENLE
ncbi:MAG: DUF3592 domain-containing protein [Thermodesulfobacteriota bacterium]|nr:DUF3592 domain-containing protein [Thermodesulfobacteriota bacterium]